MIQELRKLQERYKDDNTIVVYNLNSEQSEMIEKLKIDLKVDVFVAENMCEIVGVPYFLLIVNPVGLNDQELYEVEGEIEDYQIEDTDPKMKAALFTKKTEIEPSSFMDTYSLKMPPIFEYQYLKMTVLNRRAAIRRTKKNTKGYDKKLLRLLMLLKTLKNERVLYLENACSDLGVSKKTIRRDLQMLELIGYATKYDKKKEGYVFDFNADEFLKYL